MKPIASLELERSLLGTIVNNGSDSFFEISDLIDANCFHYDENKLIFNALYDLTKANIEKFDNNTVIQAIKKVDPNATEKYEINDVLFNCSKMAVSKENISNTAKGILRLALLRGLESGIDEAKKELRQVDPNTPLMEITGNVEKVLFQFTSKIINQQSEYVEISEVIGNFIQTLAENKKPIQGIPTGFDLFDRAIGGGLRKGGFHVIGGRAKSLKSTLGFNIGNNVAKRKIPVLFLDTEMTDKACMAKLLAMNADMTIKDIESGKFCEDKESLEKMMKLEKILSNKESFPFTYYNVSGLSHHKIISIAKKWLLKNVGFDANGNIKDCLIILDYLKMMDLKEKGNDQEYQYLGQIATDLHNFAVQYEIPLLTFVQLNRDGIDREDSGAVSGSDRIYWLCTSLSIIKKKSLEDISEDPIINGDRKLIVVGCRYGEGLRDKEYINIKSEPDKGIVTEGSSNLENLVKNKGYSKKNTNNDDDSFGL